MNVTSKNILSVIVFFFLLLLCILCCFWKFEGQVFAAIFVSVVSAYYAYQKQKIEDDKMFKELFQAFNSRYSAETNDILNELRKSSSEVSLSQIKTVENKTAENIIIDYFNLCAEEYLWYSKGRIPEDIWKAWKVGIIENMKIPQVKALYKKEVESSELSYYGLVKELGIKF